MSSKQASLNKVKDTLVKLKESIDDAEEREIEAGQQRREADNRKEKAEEERESYRRRLVLLQADLLKTKKTLEEKQGRLDHVEGRSMDDEEKRKEFEGIEMDRDDELATVEEEAVIAKEQAAESVHVLMETQRKAQVVESDLEKVYHRLEAAETKEQGFIDTIERNGQEMRDLESRDDDAAEREMEAEEKLRFLEEQLKEVVARAENAERDVVRNEIIVSGVLNDSNKIKSDHDNIGSEIEKIDELVEMINSGKIDASVPVENPEPEPGHHDDEDD